MIDGGCNYDNICNDDNDELDHFIDNADDIMIETKILYICIYGLK